MAQTTKRKHTKKRAKKRTRKNPAIVLLGIVLVLMVSMFALFHLFLGRTSSAVTEQAPSPAAAQTLPPSTLDKSCFGETGGFKTYQSTDTTGLLGIDVSSHQGTIDWSAVAASNVDYAIIRAGYRGYGDGSNNEDECFAYNIENATAAGLDVGVYFFSQALTEAEAVEEANTVLSLISGYHLTYPIYFDWEPVDDNSARTATISSSELTACAKAFCQTIEDAGYKAGIYFNLSTAIGLYQLYQLRDYDFWLAEYQDTPSYPFAFTMWQYTDGGTVPGISEHVDLNLSFQSST